MKDPCGIWMLASRIWQPWPRDGEALWMTFWIMFTIFADRLAWTTTSPSLRPGSIRDCKPKPQSKSQFQGGFGIGSDVAVQEYAALGCQITKSPLGTSMMTFATLITSASLI